MDSILFSVPGPPQGKARARTVRGKGGQTFSYTPNKTVLYENLIKVSYLQVTKKPLPLQVTKKLFNNKEPINVRITACFEPAKSTSKKKRMQMLSGEIKPTKKPDIDNITKCILDGLNGVAYRDDTQVVEVSAKKIYAEKAEVRVEITVIT